MLTRARERATTIPINSIQTQRAACFQIQHTCAYFVQVNLQFTHRLPHNTFNLIHRGAVLNVFLLLHVSNV